MNFKIIRSDLDQDELEEEVGGCAIDELEVAFNVDKNDLLEIKKRYLEKAINSFGEFNEILNKTREINDIHISIADRWQNGLIRYFLIEIDGKQYYAASYKTQQPTIFYDAELAAKTDWNFDTYDTFWRTLNS